VVRVAADGTGFVLEPSGRKFTPWGFNYDHDADLHFLEDYWDSRWSDVKADFAEMKELGANVVRIHLQLGRFMRTREEPNADALDGSDASVALAERWGCTGHHRLACYRKPTSGLVRRLSESQRWTCKRDSGRRWHYAGAASPAVFCYDLMNEPVVPGIVGGRRLLAPPFMGVYYYVQFISLDPAGRAPGRKSARQWIRRLTPAIRRHDRRT